MFSQDAILVACIGSPHGIQGAVKLKSFSANLANYEIFYDKAGVAYEIDWLRATAKHVIAKFKNIVDRSGAEGLRSTELFVKRAQLPKLELEEFYYSELAGMQLIDEQQKTHGMVKAVHNFGAGEILEIVDIAGKSFLLPFKKQLVPNIDINNRIITMSADALPYMEL